MGYKFVGFGQAFTDEKLEELKGIIKDKNPDEINNIVELGTQNGFASILLADLSKDLKSLDYNVWYVHDAREQLNANNLDNVMLYVADDLLDEFKKSITSNPEVVYIDLLKARERTIGEKVPENVDPFITELKKYQQKTSDYKKVTVIQKVDDEFVVEVIQENKRSSKKKVAEKSTVEDKTPAKVEVSA